MSSDDTIDDFIPKKVPAIIPLNFQDSKLHIDKKSSKDAKTKEKTEETSTASFLKPLTGHELSLVRQHRFCYNFPSFIQFVYCSKAKQTEYHISAICNTWLHGSLINSTYHKYANNF